MPPSQHACRASTCTADRRDISTTRSAWSAVQVHRGALRVARQTLRWRAVQRESRGTVTSCVQEAEYITLATAGHVLGHRPGGVYGPYRALARKPSRLTAPPLYLP